MLDTQQIDRLISSSRGRPGGFFRWLAALAVILLIGSVLLLLPRDDQPPAVTRLLLPWLVLLAMSAALIWWMARQRRGAQRSRLAIEALQLEDCHAAEQQLLAWLSHPVSPPVARAQGLLALATLANRQGVYAGAAKAFEALADDTQHDAFSRALGRIGLAEACLRLDRLTDAVNLLGGLRQLTLPDFVRARLELVSLFQEVSMGHAEDAAESIEARAELFRRHLSTRAGMGYALFAATCDQCGDARQAESWWKRATLLMRSDRLLADYPLLEPVANKYVGVEWPWPAS